MDQRDFDNTTRKERQAYHELLSYLKNGGTVDRVANAVAAQLPLEMLTREDYHIVAILPVRDFYKTEQSLIIYDNAVRKVSGPPFDCIKQLIRLMHGISSHSSYCSALIELLKKKYYKIPCATEFFTLIPIESVEEGSWVNIQEISEICYANKMHVQTVFTMTNHLAFTTSSGKRSINHLLGLAYRCSAIIRHEYGHKGGEIVRIPLNRFIEVPLRPYNQKIFDGIKIEDYLREPWRFTDLYIETLKIDN